LLSPILLKRLNVPGIIGLIISGVIIGPHGLNILAKILLLIYFLPLDFYTSCSLPDLSWI
jgi:Kef-type K+ transport system membrane component KefB